MLKKIGGGHLLNENNLSAIDNIYRNGEPRISKIEKEIDELRDDKSKINKTYKKDIKKENAKLVKELQTELKKLGINEKVSTSYAYTAADVRINGDLISVRFTGPLGTKIQYDGGSREINLKPSISIKDVAKKLSNLG